MALYYDTDEGREKGKLVDQKGLDAVLEWVRAAFGSVAERQLSADEIYDLRYSNLLQAALAGAFKADGS